MGLDEVLGLYVGFFGRTVVYVAVDFGYFLELTRDR